MTKRKPYHGMHGFCPQCSSEISGEQYATGFAICQCGWSDPTPKVNAEQAAEKTTIAIMIFSAFALVLVFAHMVTWGAGWLSVPILKARELTGTLSRDGYLELAQTCIGAAKYPCAKNAYIGLYRSLGDITGLINLASLQVRLGEADSALATYAAYFKAGGQDSEIMLRYAMLLEEKGQTDAALQYFESSIAAQSLAAPAALPVNATTGLVRMLIKSGKYVEAETHILNFHESAENAKGYMNTELAQLHTYFEAHPGTAGRSANIAKFKARR